MARIRTIKPEFWTSEQVMELSRDARLAFIGLWNFCDDAGIHPANPKRLKAEVFPADDLTGEDVRRLVDELIALALVDEYEIEGQRFWIVTGWHHQKIDKPTFQHPRPDGSVPDGAAKRRQTRIPPSNSTNDQRQVVERSSNASRTLDDSSPPESSRVESSLEERIKNIGSVVASGASARKNDDSIPRNEADWLRHMKAKHGFEADPTNTHDRKRYWQTFAAWANAGISTVQVDAAVAKARREATEPISNIVAYASRVLDSMIAPPQPKQRTYHDERADTIAGLTGRDRTYDPDHDDERTIDVHVHRIA